MVRAPLLATTAILCALAAPLSAQDAEAQRQAVFAQMINNPADIGLMRQYAQLSVELREFEAAAATLERLLDQDPRNTAARVELAVAYFALGNYDLAEYHLAAAQSSGQLSPTQAADVARYREAAEIRGAANLLTGRIEIGYAYSEREFDEDEGVFINAAVEWRFDLGDPNATQWVTEFGLASYAPDDDFTLNGRQNMRLRTGPEFRLNGDAFGPRLQPYVEFGWFYGDTSAARDTRSYEGGIAYQNPLSDQFTVYADISYGRTENIAEFFFGPEGYDFYEGELGLTYRPSRDTRFRVQGHYRVEADDEMFGFEEERTILGGRLAAQHAFDAPFAHVPNDWVIGGFVDLQQTDLEDGFGADERTETLYGAWLRAFVYEDVYLEVSANRLMTEEDFGGFMTESEETILTIQAGWEF